MLATLYTSVPVASAEMRNGIHKQDPQAVLADNLSAAFKSRGLSARGAADGIRKAYGISISNRTVQNMLNGTGNPQLEGLQAVSRYIRIPLWQLLCPAFQISHFESDESLHSFLEDYISLSELGRKRAARHLKGEAALEQIERSEHKTTG